MIAGRPVATRASLTAASTASAPEFDRNACHGPPGQECRQPLVQPQPRLVVDDVLLAVEQLRGLGRIAAATRGWACPVLVTPIPDE